MTLDMMRSVMEDGTGKNVVKYAPDRIFYVKSWVRIIDPISTITLR